MLPSKNELLKARIREYKEFHQGFITVYMIAKALSVEPIDCLQASLEVAAEDGRELRIVKPAAAALGTLRHFDSGHDLEGGAPA